MTRASYPPFVTTTVAAEYCGYKDTSAIRKAHQRGLLRPVGKRGGDGPWMWSVNGSFRAPTVLNKPLANVAEQVGLGKKFTQRGLRRTFNDLARAAQVHDVVTRSISGHLTESMQVHYSTANRNEQREGIARVIELASRRGVPAEAAASASGGAPGGAPTPQVVLRTKKPARGVS